MNVSKAFFFLNRAHVYKSYPWHSIEICWEHQSLIWEDLTCHRTTTEPVLWSPGATTTDPRCPKAFAPQQEKPVQWDTHASQVESSPCSLQTEKSLLRNKDPEQPKTNAEKVRTHKKKSAERKREHVNDSEPRCDMQHKMFLTVIHGVPVTSLLPVCCEDDLWSTGSQGLYVRLIPMNYKPQEVRSHIRLTGLHRGSTKHSGWYILLLKKHLLSERMFEL